jgi:hypothetical protein
LDCVSKLTSHAGVTSGLYRGSAVTVLREAQAYGVWFLSYEYLMNAHAARNKIDRNQISTPMIALYGGLAGEMLWLGSYPFDVVKSKMQTDGFGDKQRYKNMRDCFAQTWREAGPRGFWKGIGPTLLRAMPVSAGTFATLVLPVFLLELPSASIRFMVVVLALALGLCCIHLRSGSQAPLRHEPIKMHGAWPASGYSVQTWWYLPTHPVY